MRIKALSGFATAGALVLLAGVAAVADDSSLGGRAQAAQDRVEACAAVHMALPAPAVQRVRDIEVEADRQLAEALADVEGAAARHRIEELNEDDERAALHRSAPDFARLANEACAEIEAVEAEHAAGAVEPEHLAAPQPQVELEHHGGSGSGSGSGL